MRVGERLLRFYSVNELIVANAWYSHHDVHKLSWVRPGRQLKSLIDYYLVRRDIKARVHDVKVVRGAECGKRQRKDQQKRTSWWNN